MQDDAIITNGAMMLRFQQAGMVFMSITLVSTCVCQSVGSAAVFFARPFCIKLQKLFVGRCTYIL